MDPQELDALLEWADRLLRAGDGAELVAQIAGSGAVDQIWDDPAVWGALAERQGAALAWSPLLELVALREQHLDHGRRLLLPVPGQDGPTAVRSGAGSLAVRGLLLGPQSGPAHAVVTLEGGLPALVALDGLRHEPAAAWDPSLPAAVVSGEVEPVADQADLADLTDVGPAAEDVEAVVLHFLARMLVGTGEAALSVAVGHVTERTQFGRPLAAFQVPAHRLAQCRVRLSAARALLVAAVTRDAHPAGARLAKVSAGRAALEAVAAAQQLTGAMGFTEEFGLHRLVRRAYLLDSLLGGSQTAPWRIGSQAVAGSVDALEVVSL